MVLLPTLTDINKPTYSEKYNVVLKISIIGHARDLWKLTRSCKQLRLLCPPNPVKFTSYFFRGFQSSLEALKSTE